MYNSCKASNQQPKLSTQSSNAIRLSLSITGSKQISHKKLQFNATQSSAFANNMKTTTLEGILPIFGVSI